MYGREYFGVERTTFLINAEGMIVNVFEKVNQQIIPKKCRRAEEVSRVENQKRPTTVDGALWLCGFAWIT